MPSRGSTWPTSGDLRINPPDTKETLEAVSDQVEAMVRAGVMPLAVGGDHTIALGTMRGVSRALGRPVSMVQIDAHLDTWDTYFGGRYAHGTFLRRGIEEGVVDGDRSVQVGIRGPLFGPKDLERNAALGLVIIAAEEVAGRPLLLDPGRQAQRGRPKGNPAVLDRGGVGNCLNKSERVGAAWQDRRHEVARPDAGLPQAAPHSCPCTHVTKPTRAISRTTDRTVSWETPSSRATVRSPSCLARAATSGQHSLGISGPFVPEAYRPAPRRRRERSTRSW